MEAAVLSAVRLYRDLPEQVRAGASEQRVVLEDAGDWLSARAGHIQATDGLIELGDLMHLESLPLQRERFDVHVSGYIGDAVSGPTFASVATTEQVLLSLPYYGTGISLEYPAALARVAEAVETLDPTHRTPLRYAVFEHKLPQSTNRWTAAWRPWLRD